MRRLTYSASELIKDLRNEIFKIVSSTLFINGFKVKIIHNGSLSYKKLSLILCDYERRIKRIIRNIKVNPQFKIALDELNEWSNNIKAYFGLRGKNTLKFIKKYQESNEELPISRKKGLKVLNYHLDLNINYFKKINSKNKAYWLGILWAEVYLGERGELKLELSKNDEILIDRYCKAIGLNPKYKKYRTKMTKNELRTYVRITFKNSNVQSDLYTLGYVKSSKKRTRFPNLDNRELDLAFLLGFFDGDGKEGTNQFHIGSKLILEEIKKRFNIPHKINPDGKGNYYFSLGGKLFNEMLDNFPDSLSRKRKYFRVASKNIFEDSIQKDELIKLVWKMPIKKICEIYNVYPRIVNEICLKWNIKKPKPHYWHKQLKGKKFEELK
ncbi:MAG: hypothetical protein JXA99_16690 [Candidatus Lokiarchaeota archaeon]|nr:hypothetical protein [Candidatus Lokiarchaeota archaeon]